MPAGFLEMVTEMQHRFFQALAQHGFGVFQHRRRGVAQIRRRLAFTQIVGAEIASAISALAGARRKCLVLDLDNSLWGGVLGEEGIEHAFHRSG